MSNDDNHANRTRQVAEEFVESLNRGVIEEDAYWRGWEKAGMTIPALMEATLFAADKHRGQTRKDALRTPYINHPITVVHLMAGTGGVRSKVALVAGMLHDTVEDTDTTPAEIEAHFGTEVRGLVMEVTDDKSLPKAERKRLQVEHAPQLSPRAKLIKLADKIANLRDLLRAPPVDWDQARRRQYLHWSNAVVTGCRGHSESLESIYQRIATAAAATLG